jgi:hypothetical protein
MAIGKIFIDSNQLAKHLEGYPNSEMDYDDEFIFTLTYQSSKELIELMEHLKDYYGNYSDVYNEAMHFILDNPAELEQDEIEDEVEQFITEAEDFLRSKKE